MSEGEAEGESKIFCEDLRTIQGDASKNSSAKQEDSKKPESVIPQHSQQRSRHRAVSKRRLTVISV